jgi:hypothetical protein
VTATRNQQPRTAAARHHRREEARAMLAEIYNWFAEGVDTADLKDASPNYCKADCVSLTAQNVGIPVEH